MLALPLSIVGACFHEEMQKMAEERERAKRDEDEEEEVNEERGAMETIEDVLDTTDSYTQSLERLLVCTTQCACTAVDLSKGKWNVLPPTAELAASDWGPPAENIDFGAGDGESGATVELANVAPS